MRELSLHILDIVQNSLAANSSFITIIVDEQIFSDRLTIIVEDNGKGMSAETLQKALDPFFTTRTTRKIGLGIPLLKANAEACGGGFELISTLGQGTKLTAWFKHSHIDRVPLGNMVQTIIAIIQGIQSCDLRFIQKRNGDSFFLDTRDLRAQLDEVPLDNPLVLNWTKEYLQEGLTQLQNS